MLSWQTLNVVDAKVTTSVHVTAVAARFQWSFEYLDGDGKPLFTQSLPVRTPDDPESEGGGLFLPVGEPIQIDLRSEDVIHAFYVPKFLFKRDVVPGKLNTFDFTVDEAGTYRGQCAELCGTVPRLDGVRRPRRRPADLRRLGGGSRSTRPARPRRRRRPAVRPARRPGRSSR